MQHSGEYDVAIHSLPNARPYRRGYPLLLGCGGSDEVLSQKEVGCYWGPQDQYLAGGAVLEWDQRVRSRSGTTLSEMVEGIDAMRMHDNLSSAIRLFVLDAYRERIVSPPAKKAKAS